MWKVKGTLANGKEFKFDAKADLLHEAAIELGQKFNAHKIDAEIERVSFTARGAAEPELFLADKRERKARPSDGARKRSGGKKNGKKNGARKAAATNDAE